MWASVATGWGTHADALDAMAAEVTAAMLRAAAPRPGERVLELADAAPGGVGLAAAATGADSVGEVVLSDVVPEMTGIAAARAGSTRRARNVRTRCWTSRRSTSRTRRTTVVLCREG